MEQKQAQEYFNVIMGKFKNNPEDDSLSREEKILLQNIITLSSNLEKISKDIQKINEESDIKNKEMVFMQGKLQGLVEALIQLKVPTI